VSIHTFTLHRDPRNFSPLTDEFWPERWLVAQGSTKLPSSIAKAEFVHNTAAFIPFSYGEPFCSSGRLKESFLMCPFRVGPTNCVGKPLAILGTTHSTITLKLY